MPRHNDDVLFPDTGRGVFNGYGFEPLLRAVPVAALALTAAAVLGWRAAGSTAADDWLSTALLAALLVAAVLASGAAVAPTRLAVLGLAGMVALVAWTAASLTWAPVPSLARDEALLVLLYTTAVALPLIVLRTPPDRLIAIGTIAAAAAASAVAAGVAVATDGDPSSFFRSGRLEYPIGYTNAQAAVFVIGLWPALALAAGRRLPILVRALAVGGAAVSLAAWLTTQSKGAGIGLLVSAVAVFALADGRLRLAVPTLLAGACAAAAAAPLTEPYRADEAAADAAAAGAGRALVAVFAAGVVAGLLYTLVDHRLRLSQPTARRVRLAATIGFAILAVTAAAVVVAATGRPDHALARGWTAFSTYHPEEGGAGTHLASLGGSNRYDFWRVSLDRFADEPVTGVGSRGFGTVYLQDGRSHETPARAHSIVFDTLLELGIVGTVLLALALAPFLWLAARAARRRRAYGVAALGGCAGWIGHAAVDWTWTFPAAGVPFFLLLGIGASRTRTAPLPRRAATAGAAAVTAAAALVFAPPWLAGRFVDRALTDPRAAARDLRWARALDPISSRALVVESNLARSPSAAIPPLREAAEREPRAVAVRFLLGMRLLEAGRADAAVLELERARELAPREELVTSTLERARREAAG